MSLGSCLVRLGPTSLSSTWLLRSFSVSFLRMLLGFTEFPSLFFFLGATGGPCHCDEPMKEKGKTTHRHVNENESGGSRASFVFLGFFSRVPFSFAR